MNRPVLYAEDDENDAFFMQRAFAKLNCAERLRIEPNGTAAMSYLMRAKESGALPSLVLLDVKMPGFSGLELLASLRQFPEFADVPIVMFSSSTQESDRKKAKQLGADAYLVKPSNAENLTKLVEQFLSLPPKTARAAAAGLAA